MVDIGVLKAPEGNLVRVRVPPGPPKDLRFGGGFLLP